MGQLSDKQFDQLVVFLLEELGSTADIQFVPESTDSSVDIEVTMDHPFVELEYGVHLVHLPPTEALRSRSVEQFATDLEAHSAPTGVVVTSGKLPEAVRSTASERGVTVLSGTELSQLLVDHELGFVRSADGITIDTEFWDLFRGQVRRTTIPSREIPQADSVDRLGQVLRAIDAGHCDKWAIAEAVETVSGDSLDPRQADYYCLAGWLLEFLHEDRDSDGEPTRGRWALTRRGQTYLSHRAAANDSAAEALLQQQIRRIEILRRILDALRENGTMIRAAIADLVEEETELTGTTVSRRTLTLVRWLEELPKVSTTGTGPEQKVWLAEHATEQETLTDCQADSTASESTSSDPDSDPPDESTILDDITASFDLPAGEE